MYNLKDLISNIKNIYTDKVNYEMHKSVIDFHAPDGSYIGDYFNLFVQERVNNGAPKIYHIGGPFDTISNKAPQIVLGFQGGKNFINQDITHEVDIRTAAMNFVIFSSLGIKELYNKNILIIGTGKIGKELLRQLKEYDSNITNIDYNTSKHIDTAFEEFGNNLQIKCNSKSIDSLSKYDIIILHTSSKESIINKKLFDTTKSNVIINTFAGSHTQGEIEGIIYTDSINLIVDREQTLKNANEVNEQIEIGNIKLENIVMLDDLIKGNKKIIANNKTIYRSTGAPMQTLAIVKLLPQI